MRTLTIADPALIVASSSWTPAFLPGLVAWWDASEASTFTYGSGSEVASWASRVGSYSLGQSTASKRPSRSATIGGKSAVQFGADDALSVASFDMGVGQKVSLWIVCTVPAGSDRILMEHSADFGSNDGAFLCYRHSTNVVRWGRRAGGLDAMWATTGSLTTTAKAFIGVSDGTLSTDETSGWLNTTMSGSRPDNNNTNVANRNDTLYVGARGGSSLYSSATIAEMGVSTSAFTSSEVSALTTYLMVKWSL